MTWRAGGGLGRRLCDSPEWAQHPLVLSGAASLGPFKKSCAPTVPCKSCPYRRDVPSGVWDESEYAKLPLYDGEIWTQPTGIFVCHQQDGRVCAGWAGTHDMEESLSLRLAAAAETISVEDLDAIRDYVSPVLLFRSGQEAADHGRAEIERPGEDAVKTIRRLRRRL